MIGGMVSSTVLTLAVIAVLYALANGHGLPAEVQQFCEHLDLVVDTSAGS